MLKLESLNNPIISGYLKLKEKKYRDESNLYLAYGKHQLTEITNKSIIKEILSTDEKIASILVTPKIIKAFSQTVTPIDPVLVLAKDEQFAYSNKILILDNIQNPDNLGAIIRSMVAFNIKNLILSNNSCDIYNDKVIRAAQGGLFKLDFKRANLIEEITYLKNNGYLILGTYPYKDNSANLDIFKNNKIALIIGNEGNGISDNITNLVDHKVSIKTANLESLNASVATGIILYEWMKHAG